MPTSKNSADDVYSHYIDEFGLDEDGDVDARALFAYALVEKDKYEWIEHFKSNNNGAPPPPTDVIKWFSSKPPNYFDEKSVQAVAWYKAFARALLHEEFEDARQNAIKEYIGAKLDFWPQLFLSLVSNVIFIILLGALAAYVAADFSPIAWVKAHLGGATAP